MKEKICITGMGLLGSFGIGKEAFRQAISGGRSCLKPVGKYDFDRLAGEVPDFNLADYFRDKRTLKYAAVTQYALAAAKLAVDDSGLNTKNLDSEKMAIFFATDAGGGSVTETICDTIIEKGYKSVNPILFQQSVFNAPASLLSIIWGIKGPCITLPMGFSSGGAALDIAASYFLNHDIDTALVIASDELAEVAHRAYDHLKLLTPNNDREEGMRPFDADRNGFAASEGAAALILERESSALARQSRIYGYIAGSSMASDGYRPADIDPMGTGASLAMTRAISDAGLDREDIDLVVAMAPSDQKVDKMEATAIRGVFGHPDDDVPVTSIKSSIGESFASAGLFNVCAALQAIEAGMIPPTINFNRPDPDIDLDIVANTARAKKVDTVLCNAYSWGGIYNTVIARRYA
ncbi:MAG: beta-ketoacyl-[acyl-carrier-protein] synthase family protein [Pseudomonadota bacterium]